MKKGETGEGIAEKILFPDKAVVRTEDGGAIQVKYALPGQRVRFRVTKKRKDRLEGQLLEVISHAEGELPSDCPKAGSCGGCLYRTLPYDRQLAVKEGQIRDLLGQIGAEKAFEGILPSPETEGYRNKMELTFGDAHAGGELVLGMHCRGSFYDIAGVEDCVIMHRDMRLAAACVQEHFRALGIPYYHRMKHTGVLRHLLLRRSRATGELLVALVTVSQASGLGLDELAQKLCAIPFEGSLAGFLHMENDSVADAVQSENTEVILGKDWITERLLGLSFRITLFSFFQTNSAGAERLYEVVREFIGETKDKTIYDLYSGTGTIAQVLAPVAGMVTGVEIVPEAVEAARENARENGLPNCRFIAGDVLKVIEDLPGNPGLLILDPPRDGIHPRALPRLIAFGSERIVYVSCKPTSLIRDLPAFTEGGYRIARIKAVDMFPATGNTEVVTLLEKC